MLESPGFSGEDLKHKASAGSKPAACALKKVSGTFLPF
jgi:hypothetical protein